MLNLNPCLFAKVGALSDWASPHANSTRLHDVNC
jgi:hypothetical protein